MTITEMSSLLNLECVQNNFSDREITSVYTSDLLSDVLANAAENSVLITIQAHKNTVAVASLKHSPSIIICNNREVPQDMISSASEENIAIFRTKQNQFTVSGKLFSELYR